MGKNFISRCKQFYWAQLPRVDEYKLRARIAILRLRNFINSTSAISKDSDAVVSLTTYGHRLADVHLTIESIAAGNVKPKRMILWLDENTPLPKGLTRLVKRGVEVKSCENFGPHKKYYPYVESESQFVLPLVTADDDVIYPASWLEGLLLAHKNYPNFVNCYRARDILLESEWFAPYLEWPLTQDCIASIAKMATGVSGVIYPTALLEKLKSRGREFSALCPRADDLWLHLVAMQYDFPVRQLSPISVDYGATPGSQDGALYISNQFGGENDRQIRATYQQVDFDKLKNSTNTHHVLKR